MRPQPKIPLASSANTTLSFNAYDFSQESLFSHISVHVHAKDRQGKKQNKTDDAIWPESRSTLITSQRPPSN